MGATIACIDSIVTAGRNAPWRKREFAATKTHDAVNNVDEDAATK